MKMLLSASEIESACAKYVWEKLAVYRECTASLSLVVTDDGDFTAQAWVECPNEDNE